MSNSSSWSIERRRLLFATAALLLSPPAAARSGPRTPGDAAPVQSAEIALAPQLAAVYAGQVDPAALLREREVRRRSRALGRPRAAPSQRPGGVGAAFVPRRVAFGTARRRVVAWPRPLRREHPAEREWREVRYRVFDTPGQGLPFAARLDRLKALSSQLATPVELAPQWRVADRSALERTLARIVAAGGEGLVLHVADAAYVPGRSEALLKMKPHLDAEAVVVGHRPGTGKYRGLVGALEVESAQGRRFFVGSGLSDAARRERPAIGTTITYRYRE